MSVCVTQASVGPKEKRSSRKEGRDSTHRKHHTPKKRTSSEGGSLSSSITLFGGHKQNKSGYEETPGITTPSHEKGISLLQTPLSPSLALLQCESRFEPLKEDQNVKIVSGNLLRG